jgi:hypothetical protein
MKDQNISVTYWLERCSETWCSCYIVGQEINEHVLLCSGISPATLIDVAPRQWNDATGVGGRAIVQMHVVTAGFRREVFESQ